jgi:hypothetical protein
VHLDMTSPVSDNWRMFSRTPSGPAATAPFFAVGPATVAEQRPSDVRR